jgi:hypothetical protein
MEPTFSSKKAVRKWARMAAKEGGEDAYFEDPYMLRTQRKIAHKIEKEYVARRQKKDPACIFDRVELERYLECRRLAAWFAERGRDSAVAALIRGHLWDPDASRTVARLRDRLLNALGQAHERRGEFDEALESYALSRAHPARDLDDVRGTPSARAVAQRWRFRSPVAHDRAVGLRPRGRHRSTDQPRRRLRSPAVPNGSLRHRRRALGDEEGLRAPAA